AQLDLEPGVQISGPTLVRDGPDVILVLRTETPEEGQKFEVYVSDGDDFWIPRSAIVPPPSNDVLAFDMDERAQPSLHVRRGTWRLHFGARRGTRWSIGHWVSHDLRQWVAPTGG